MSECIACKTLAHTTEMLVRHAKFLLYCERTTATSETLSGVFQKARLSCWQLVQLVLVFGPWYLIAGATGLWASRSSTYAVHLQIYIFGVAICPIMNFDKRGSGTGWKER